MKRLILLVALVMAMAVLAPAAFADDTDVDTDDVEMEEKDPSEAQLFKAEMIADYFSVSPDVVMSIRTGQTAPEAVGHAVGWGVLYKLMLYVGPDGIGAMDFEGGWAIGQLRKTYLQDPESASADAPMNFGQLQKAEKDKPGKPDKVMPSRANKDKHKHED